jgi:hypothetical protein
MSFLMYPMHSGLNSEFATYVHMNLTFCFVDICISYYCHTSRCMYILLVGDRVRILAAPIFILF